MRVRWNRVAAVLLVIVLMVVTIRHWDKIVTANERSYYSWTLEAEVHPFYYELILGLIAIGVIIGLLRLANSK